MAIKNRDTKSDVTKELDELLNSVSQDFTQDDNLAIAVNKFLDRVRKNIKEYDLYASGRLYQSLKPVEPFKKKGNITVVEIEAEDYYKDLEEGTKPKGFTKENFKALQPQILEWIKYKETLSSIANTEWRRRAFSYLITRSILRKGTIKRFGYKGKRFLSGEIPQLEKDIIKAVENKWQ